MGKYEIKVKVELVECEEKEQHVPTRQQDGSFTMRINEEEAISIDKCEGAVLRTAWPTIREAISKHLSEVSKKKPMKKQHQGK
jgi:predicted transcriptional regulator